MGNEKANSYWEAELPPNYDRVGIENFIRAKYGIFIFNDFCHVPLFHVNKLTCDSSCLYLTRYDEKRWVPKDGKSMSPARRLEEKPSVQSQTASDRSGYGHVSSSGNSSDERKNVRASSAKTIPAARISVPTPPKGAVHVCSVAYILPFPFRPYDSLVSSLLHLFGGVNKYLFHVNIFIIT